MSKALLILRNFSILSPITLTVRPLTPQFLADFVPAAGK
jgi:hypothetical protein